jgi:hypothetical protein
MLGFEHLHQFDQLLGSLKFWENVFLLVSFVVVLNK